MREKIKVEYGKKKTFNILFIGDIYGKVGRRMIRENLYEIREKNEIDLVIANGENVTHGKSISYKHYRALRKLGVNVVTSGNHIFSRPEVKKYIGKVSRLLRPANYGPYSPGVGTIVISRKKRNIRITNLIGRTFMDKKGDNQYYCLEKILDQDKNDEVDFHIVDFHAEATAEKKVFAWYFDGKINCLFGTHTHVQTNDEAVLPFGTAYISDVGFTGPYYSIIGANPKEVIERDKEGISVPLKPAEGEGILSGVVVKLNIKSKKVEKIKKILITPFSRVI